MKGHSYNPEGCPKCGKIHIPTFLGRHHTSENKKIIGDKNHLANTGKQRTPEQKKHYKEGLFGLPKSAEHCLNLSKALKGKHCNLKTEFNSENQKGEKNSFYNKHHSEVTINLLSKKASDRLMKGFGHSKGVFYSSKNNKNFCYRSSWELYFMKFLEIQKDVVSYKYEPLKIKYLDENNIQRFIVPDFLVSYFSGKQELVEIRPIWRLKSKRTKLSMLATANYCKENNKRYIWINDFLNETNFNLMYLVY